MVVVVVCDGGGGRGRTHQKDAILLERCRNFLRTEYTLVLLRNKRVRDVELASHVALVEVLARSAASHGRR